MKAVFINIFGGILRCDILATGVVNAARELQVGIPLVVRMEGPHVQEGKRILKESGLAFIVAEGMMDGADNVVAAVAGSKLARAESSTVSRITCRSSRGSI